MLAFLGAVSEALAPVVKLEELLEVVRTLPVPFAADWTMVHEQTEEGPIRSEAGVHLAPERAPLLANLAGIISASLPADSSARAHHYVRTRPDHQRQHRRPRDACRGTR